MQRLNQIKNCIEFLMDEVKNPDYITDDDGVTQENELVKMFDVAKILLVRYECECSDNDTGMFELIEDSKEQTRNILAQNTKSIFAICLIKTLQCILF